MYKKSTKPQEKRTTRAQRDSKRRQEHKLGLKTVKRKIARASRKANR